MTAKQATAPHWGLDGKARTFICQRCHKRWFIDPEQCINACSCGFSVEQCRACERLDPGSVKVAAHLEAYKRHVRGGGLPP